ncbi:MAG: hypothetical protein LIO53_02920, partial [Oscillospiraceae bacterium]|nr:hypothetical protein [Oscillospiraceae bacterium]
CIMDKLNTYKNREDKIAYLNSLKFNLEHATQTNTEFTVLGVLVAIVFGYQTRIENIEKIILILGLGILIAALILYKASTNKNSRFHLQVIKDIWDML